MENQNNISDSHKNNECIWMEANVVAYKLCDQEYECEKCSFDFVMRNTWKEKTDAEEAKLNFGNNSLIENYIRKITAQKFDEKLIYLKNQLVLKHLFGGVYSIGISPLVADLIENIEEIKFPKDFGQVKKDDVIIELIAEWGNKKIYSPFDFVLLQKMDINIRKLPGDIWFGVASISLNKITSVIYSQVLWRAEYCRLLNQLRSYQSFYPQVGVTMMDGGKRIEYLYEAIGVNEYEELLNRIYY